MATGGTTHVYGFSGTVPDRTGISTTTSGRFDGSVTGFTGSELSDFFVTVFFSFSLVFSVPSRVSAAFLVAAALGRPIIGRLENPPRYPPACRRFLFPIGFANSSDSSSEVEIAVVAKPCSSSALVA